MVTLNDKNNYIKENGEFLSEVWFDEAFGFTNKYYAYIKKDGILGRIYQNGNIEWENK